MRYIPHMRQLTPEEARLYNPQRCPEITERRKATLVRKIEALRTCVEAGHSLAAERIIEDLPSLLVEWNMARAGFPGKDEEE